MKLAPIPIGTRLCNIGLERRSSTTYPQLVEVYGDDWPAAYPNRKHPCILSCLWTPEPWWWRENRRILTEDRLSVIQIIGRLTRLIAIFTNIKSFRRNEKDWSVPVAARSKTRMVLDCSSTKIEYRIRDGCMPSFSVLCCPGLPEGPFNEPIPHLGNHAKLSRRIYLFWFGPGCETKRQENDHISDKKNYAEFLSHHHVENYCEARIVFYTRSFSPKHCHGTLPKYRGNFSVNARICSLIYKYNLTASIYYVYLILLEVG
jgi:hypothetical protein